jgi:hypothetical protein
LNSTKKKQTQKKANVLPSTKKRLSVFCSQTRGNFFGRILFFLVSPIRLLVFAAFNNEVNLYGLDCICGPRKNLCVGLFFLKQTNKK